MADKKTKSPKITHAIDQEVRAAAKLALFLHGGTFRELTHR